MQDVRRAAEDRAHYLTLYSDTAPMYDSQGHYAQPVRFFEIGLHGCLYITWSDRVEIKDVCYGYAYRIFVITCHGIRGVHPRDC